MYKKWKEFISFQKCQFIWSTVDSHEKGEEGKTKGYIFIAYM